MKSLVLLLLIVCCVNLSYGQAKVEREKKIKKAEIPAVINQTLDPLIKDARRIKYYEEFDGKKMSYESKFILHKQHYSAEFDSLGVLEDIEVIVCFTELHKSLQERMVKYLLEFDDFKVRKTQRQFSSNSMSDEVVIKNAFQNSSAPQVRYELIVEVKENKTWLTYEMLFDDTGSFLSQQQVVTRSEDYLLY